MPDPTPPQTVGPFFHGGLVWTDGAIVDPNGVEIRGRVLDGNGEPVTDALVETWQADPPGFGRCATDAEGRYRIVAPKTPHIDVSVFARGLLDRVVTRMYLNADDADVPDPTLMAQADGDGYVFDIRLQGDGETTFFAV